MTTRTRTETAGAQAAKQELIKMLNQALELEHAARIQYLSHRRIDY